MVKWRGREASRNVEDRRGIGTAAGMSGLAVLILRFVMSRWGFGGVAVLVAGFFALNAVGIDPLALLSGQPASGKRELTEADEEAGQFVGAVLGETEQVWSDYFARSGEDYPEPKLVMFTGQVQSACGMASAAAGPFYCPADRQVYLDTNFFDELARRFGAPGDFAAAYVVAHEVGHHIQTITGVSDKVRAAQGRASQEEGNAIQVKMELQADCYAGVWARSAQQKHDFLDEGDIEEGLKAASAIGDDTLQKNAGRRVTPESFTHGTSEQRQQWFYRGYESGDPDACDTFGRQTSDGAQVVSSLENSSLSLAQGSVDSESHEMSFDDCLKSIRGVAAQLGVAPVNIAETLDLRMVRYQTADGSVIVTCSRPDRKMVITRSAK